MFSLKNIIVYFSLMCFLADLSYSSYIFIDYILNHDYYANTLCINKDKPELACNGQCVLMQKLAFKSLQQNEKKQKQIVEVIDFFENLFFEEVSIVKEQYYSLIFTNENSFSNKQINAFDYHQSLIEPPQVF